MALTARGPPAEAALGAADMGAPSKAEPSVAAGAFANVCCRLLMSLSESRGPTSPPTESKLLLNESPPPLAPPACARRDAVGRGALMDGAPSAPMRSGSHS